MSEFTEGQIKCKKNWSDFKGLTRDDFNITIDGVLIKYNSNIIKYIMKLQKDSGKLNDMEESVKTAIKNMNDYTIAVNEECKEYPYIDIRTIIKEYNKLYQIVYIPCSI